MIEKLKRMNAQQLADEFAKDWSGTAFPYRFWRWLSLFDPSVNVEDEKAQQALQILELSGKIVEED